MCYTQNIQNSAVGFLLLLSALITLLSEDRCFTHFMQLQKQKIQGQKSHLNHTRRYIVTLRQQISAELLIHVCYRWYFEFLDKLTSIMPHFLQQKPAWTNKVRKPGFCKMMVTHFLLYKNFGSLLLLDFWSDLEGWGAKRGMTFRKPWCCQDIQDFAPCRNEWRNIGNSVWEPESQKLTNNQSIFGQLIEKLIWLTPKFN